MSLTDRVAKNLAGLSSRSSAIVPVDVTWSQTSGQVPTYPLSWPGWPDRAQTGNILTQTITDPAARARLALQSAWVFSNVNLVAQEFSTAHIEILANEQADPDHPFVQLWNRPNPHMGRGFVMQYWCWQLMLFGKAFLFFAPSGVGQPVEVWPVPSACMRPVRFKDDVQFISAYAWQPRADVKPMFIDPQYICFSHGPHPFDLLEGFGALDSVTPVVQTDLAQQQWNRELFGRDNAMPTAIVTTRPDITPSDFKRFKQELFDFYGGGQRRTMVAPGGEVDVKILSLGQKEMDFINSRELSMREIDRAFGFPGGFWEASATEANARHAKAVLLEMTVWPKHNMLAEDLNTQHLSRWYGPDETAAFADIRPRNIELDIKVKDSRKSTWTVNELRQDEGLDPLDDALFNTVPAEIAMSRWQPPTPEPAPIQPAVVAPVEVLPDADDEDGENTDIEPEEAPETTPESASPPAEKRSAVELRLWRKKALRALESRKRASVPFSSTVLLPRLHERITTQLADAPDGQAVSQTFDAYLYPAHTAHKAARDEPEDMALRRKREKAAQELYAAVATGQLSRIRAVLKKAHQDGLADDRMRGLVPEWATDEVQRMVQLLLPFVDDTLLIAAQHGLDALPVAVVNFDTVNEAVLALATDRATRLATDYTDASRQLVDRIIADWIRTGGTMPDLLARVARAWPDSRAETYAITAVTSLFAAGNKAAWAASPLVQRYAFHTVVDSRVCPICEPFNGQVYDLSDERHTPAIHYRCRCFMTPVVEVV